MPKDRTALYPFINSVIKGSVYSIRPVYIKFTLGEHLFLLTEKSCSMTPVANLSEALEALDKLLHFLDFIGQIRSSIIPDHQPYSPQSPIDIYRLLPGTNCRECGFLTCLAFAAALSRSATSSGRCPYFASPVAEKAVYRITDSDGKQVAEVELPLSDSNQHISLSKQQQINDLKKKLRQLEHPSQAPELPCRPFHHRLTIREQEVLFHMARGATNGEIGKLLDISINTVKTHVVHIYDKIGVRDRSQASVWAIKNGIDIEGERYRLDEGALSSPNRSPFFST